MANDWLDKAKEAAKRAAEEAKKLAETAKNANYGEMLDKTKNMAMHAAGEAKKAADNIIKKETPQTEEVLTTSNENSAHTHISDENSQQILIKLVEVDRLLHEIKSMLK